MTQVTAVTPALPGPASAATRRAYAAIRDGISQGRLAPGSWLREGALGGELGLSRTPVREALRGLAAEGLVELVHNRGARVVRWTAEDVEETYRLRALLEGEAAALAARRATAGQVAVLAQTCAAHERSVADRQPAVEIAARNDAFHAAVLAAAASPRLGSLHAVVTRAPLVARALSGYDAVDLQRSVIAHRDVLLAVQERDEDLAAAAMRAHILAARHVAQRAAATP